MQENLLALEREAPGRQHRLSPLPGPQPLGDAVDEEVGDLELAKVALGEAEVVRPEPLPHLRDRRARQQQAPTFFPEGIFDVAHRETARQHLHG